MVGINLLQITFPLLAQNVTFCRVFAHRACESGDMVNLIPLKCIDYYTGDNWSVPNQFSVSETIGVEQNFLLVILFIGSL